MITIARCGYDDIRHFVPRAKSEQLTFAKSTELYAVYLGNKMIGMCGLILHGKSCVFKNAYLSPEYRGKGYYKYMLEERVKLARSKGITTITANCTPDSIRSFMNRGFQATKIYKNGVIKAVKKYE